MFSTVMKRAALLAALMMLLVAAASAQTMQIEGTVKLKAADGSMKPVAGAQIDLYRTDIKGQYSVKADKNGRFIRLGIPIQGTFTIVASGPGCEPTWQVGVRVSQVPMLDFVLNPGDGKVPTYDEVLAAIKSGPASSGAPTVSAADKAKMDAAEKERLAENEKLKGLQATRDDAINHFKQGIVLRDAKNLPGALTEFEQAAAIDATKHASFIEVAHKANVQLSETHYYLGADLFNNKQRDAAKPHFEKAYEAAQKAITYAAMDTADPNIKNSQITYNQVLVKNAMLLVEHFNEVKLVDDTVKALDSLETLDPANKGKYEVQKGDLYRFAGNSDPAMAEKAVATYKNILAGDPNNVEALYNLGITLLGSSDKEKIQESLNYLSDFVAKAPATDKRVPDAKATITAIKEQYKIDAEKPAARGRRKP
ncbi:MAG: carboxypeptidase regulatory-like domain-containing protein [Blastocatellia bacterium]